MEAGKLLEMCFSAVEVHSDRITEDAVVLAPRMSLGDTEEALLGILKAMCLRVDMFLVGLSNKCKNIYIVPFTLTEMNKSVLD